VPNAGPPPGNLASTVGLVHRANRPPPSRTLTIDLGALSWRTVLAIRDDLMNLRDASLGPIIGELDQRLREGSRR
jgi:hypothetical protein